MSQTNVKQDTDNWTLSIDNIQQLCCYTLDWQPVQGVLHLGTIPSKTLQGLAVQTMAGGAFGVAFEIHK